MEADPAIISVSNTAAFLGKKLLGDVRAVSMGGCTKANTYLASPCKVEKDPFERTK